MVWKTRVPGLGGSTPIVSDGVVYLTAGDGGKNQLFGLDFQSGDQIFATELGDDTGNKHRKGGGSNPSVAIGRIGGADGRNVAVAYFRSGDLAAVDATGKILWHWNVQERFDDDTLWWDLGSSPVVHGDAVFLAVVQTGPSYLIKIDLATGEVVFKRDRDVPAPEEAAQTYATPVITRVGDREVVAILGADHLTVHDINDGSVLGKLGGFNPTDNHYFRSIASPVCSGDVLIFPYARGETVTAIDLKRLIAPESSTAASDAILWQIDSIGSDVPTPAVDGDTVYIVDDSKAGKGTVAALDLRSGKTLWTTQLVKSRHTVSASPIVAEKHLYVVREDGMTSVIGPLYADEPRVLHENALDDAELYTVASPVAVGNSLLIRTRHTLYRFSENP